MKQQVGQALFTFNNLSSKLIRISLAFFVKLLYFSRFCSSKAMFVRSRSSFDSICNVVVSSMSLVYHLNLKYFAWIFFATNHSLEKFLPLEGSTTSKISLVSEMRTSSSCLIQKRSKNWKQEKVKIFYLIQYGELIRHQLDRNFPGETLAQRNLKKYLRLLSCQAKNFKCESTKFILKPFNQISSVQDVPPVIPTSFQSTNLVSIQRNGVSFVVVCKQDV